MKGCHKKIRETISIHIDVSVRIWKGEGSVIPPLRIGVIVMSDDVWIIVLSADALIRRLVSEEIVIVISSKFRPI